MARRRTPDAPAEMPARLRTYHPDQWPDRDTWFTAWLDWHQHTGADPLQSLRARAAAKLRG
jgi:hypothetical protein